MREATKYWPLWWMMHQASFAMILGGQAGFAILFGIGYADDIDKAKGVLESILDGTERVLKSPAPVVQVHELADSSVNFVVRPWTKTSDYWTVYWDLTADVKTRFDAAGISIPFPQQDVHHHGTLPVVHGSDAGSA